MLVVLLGDAIVLVVLCRTLVFTEDVSYGYSYGKVILHAGTAIKQLLAQHTGEQSHALPTSCDGRYAPEG